MRILPILGLLIAFFLVKLSQYPELLNAPLIAGYSPGDQDGPGGLLGLTTLIGGIIVFLFYWFKFNEWAGSGEAPTGFRPRPARHFTTWVRFLGWNSFYGLLMVLCYCVFVLFPEFVFLLVDRFSGAAGAVNTSVPAIEGFQDLLHTVLGQDGPTTSAAPVQPEELAPFAVMLTTVVWAGMKPFSDFEKRFRLRLQENAAIPTQARELVETFEKEADHFAPDPETVSEVVEELGGNQLSAEDFSDKGDNLWFRYARIRYLNYLLQKYNRTPVFSRLAERYDDEFRELEVNIEQLKSQVAQRIADIERFASELKLLASDPSGETDLKQADLLTTRSTLKAAEQWLERNLTAENFRDEYFKTQKDALKESLFSVSCDIVQLIICGVLAVGRSPSQRRDMLEAFGFTDHNRITRQMDSVTLTWVAGIALGLVFICSTIYYGIANALDIAKKLSGLPLEEMIPKDVTEVLGWSIMACLMHLLATGAGYLFQRSLESSRERLRIGKQKPLHAMTQIAEATWASIIGFSLNVCLIGALVAMDGNFPKLGESWWWALVPAVTAYFTALYTQKVKRTEAQRGKFLWWQGAITGLAATFVFVLLLAADFTDGSSQTIDAIGVDGVFIIGLYIGITTTILGIALGYILNLWVIAEGYTKGVDKRSDQRRFLLFNRGKWKSGSSVFPVRAMSVSSSGAELKSHKPLAVDTVGDLKLPIHKVRRAQVVRVDPKDSHHSIVKFIESEAT